MIKVESVLLTLDDAGGTTASASKPTTTSSQAASTPAVAASNGATSSYSVKLPELGEGVTEGELIKWLVKPGDSIKADQSIAEIMTDKATVEVPSPKAGVVSDLKFKAGEVVKVDSILATLQVSGSAPAQATTSAHTQAPAKTAAAPAVGHVVSSSMSASSSAGLSMSSHSGGSSTTTAFFPPVMDSRVLATPATIIPITIRATTTQIHIFLFLSIVLFSIIFLFYSFNYNSKYTIYDA
jgi:pyruvate dehydrogenase E2 component (dihydrolipoamide acetyltransferase)